MTTSTLHIPQKNITLELTPEFADMIASAVEDYREKKSDETLRASIMKNQNIVSHTDRIRSLHHRISSYGRYFSPPFDIFENGKRKHHR